MAYADPVMEREYQREWKKRWRERNREAHRANARAYYAKNQERIGGQRKQVRENNKEREAEWQRRKLYGLLPGEFEEMMQAQRHACAICRVALDSSTKILTPHVDHCHESGVVRGILCGNCNHLLGRAKDRPEVLEAAIAYLVQNAPDDQRSTE
jgi:hypothetical protein